MRHQKPFVPMSRPKSCGKNCYASRAEAISVAREQEIIFASSDLKLRPYCCPNCHSWHLASIKNPDSDTSYRREI